MSDEQENLDQSNEQEIDLVALANAGDQTEQHEEQQEENNLSDFEQKQYDQGWRPLDDFSGPEDNWKTAKEFQRDGEWLAKLKEKDQRLDRIERDFEVRIDNVNKFNKAQTDAKIKSLQAEQRSAVDMSDTEAFDSAQSKIEELQKEDVPEQVAQQPDRDIEDWNKKNPWFFESGEKSNDAKAFYNSYADANPNATTSQVLEYLDKKINQLYPTNNNNPRRNQPNTTENNTRRTSRQNKSLTMSDLTNDERQQWSMFGSQMFTEAEFLKTVADTRKG
jgi:hypothetical protein